MGRVKTFVNGGTLLPGDLNSMEDDYEFAFSTYKQGPAAARTLIVPTGQTTGTFLLCPEDYATPTPIAPGVTNAYAFMAFYFDPADHAANTRTLKLRMRAECHVNAVSPLATFTVGLYPVATWGGGSGQYPFIATLGTLVTGSTVAFATPTANANTQANSGDFTAPAAGFYALAVVQSGGTTTTNSYVQLRAAMQMRQV